MSRKGRDKPQRHGGDEPPARDAVEEAVRGVLEALKPRAPRRRSAASRTALGKAAPGKTDAVKPPAAPPKGRGKR